MPRKNRTLPRAFAHCPRMLARVLSAALPEQIYGLGSNQQIYGLGSNLNIFTLRGSERVWLGAWLDPCALSEAGDGIL